MINHRRFLWLEGVSLASDVEFAHTEFMSECQLNGAEDYGLSCPWESLDSEWMADDTSITAVMRRDVREYNPIKIGCPYTVLGAWEFDDKGPQMGYSVHQVTLLEPDEALSELQFACEYI